MTIKDTAERFKEFSPIYDEFIRQVVARYDEMIGIMFHYIPAGFEPESILELGIGTGNVTERLVTRWPNANITAVDLSPDMMAKAKEKFPNANITYEESAFEQFKITPSGFDLVISNLAIHHLTDSDKQSLFQKICWGLKPGGIFMLADQIRGINTMLNEGDWMILESHAREKGLDDDTIQHVREHVNEVDQAATLPQHLEWFKRAGFQNIDVLWRYGPWTVLQGQKAG